MLYRELRPISNECLNKITSTIKSKYDNIILQEYSVLDLFSGVGTFGIYCIKQMSAKYVIFVDKNAGNLRKTHVHLSYRGFTNFKCIKSDCTKLVLKNIEFNIIMIDPPYKYHLLTSMLNLISKLQIYNESSLIICRKHRKEEVSLPINMRIDHAQCKGHSEILYIKLQNQF